MFCRAVAKMLSNVIVVKVVLRLRKYKNSGDEELGVAGCGWGYLRIFF